MEEFAKRVAGSAAGVADQADAKAARAKLGQDIVRTRDDRWQHLDRRTRVDVFERGQRRFIDHCRIDLERLEKMLDLHTAGDVFIARPVQLQAAMPEMPIRLFDSLRRLRKSALDGDALHPLP